MKIKTNELLHTQIRHT